MDYFENKENALSYIKMAEGYDGRELIEKLRTFLPQGSTLLELGMGPGVDLDILKKFYHVTGSDRSEPFLKLYKEKNREADLLNLDAVTLSTDQTFDGIYSNKVLVHLTPGDLKNSIERQYVITEDNGILLHSFWKGSKTENMHGIHFQYYMEDDLVHHFSDLFEVLELSCYRELEDDDSIVIILKRK